MTKEEASACRVSVLGRPRESQVNPTRPWDPKRHRPCGTLTPVAQLLSYRAAGGYSPGQVGRSEEPTHRPRVIAVPRFRAGLRTPTMRAAAPGFRSGRTSRSASVNQSVFRTDKSPKPRFFRLTGFSRTMTLPKIDVVGDILVTWFSAAGGRSFASYLGISVMDQDHIREVSCIRQPPRVSTWPLKTVPARAMVPGFTLWPWPQSKSRRPCARPDRQTSPPRQ